MRFFQAIFLGLFLLSKAEGKEEFHAKGPFDLDENKSNELSQKFKEYFNLTVKETLSTWTIMETSIGISGLIGVLILNQLI